jgi:hypothetical protein
MFNFVLLDYGLLIVNIYKKLRALGMTLGLTQYISMSLNKYAKLFKTAIGRYHF